MRALIFLLIIFINGNLLFCQNRVYSTTKTNLLYAEILNPFKIVYQNLNCDSIEIESKDCFIRKANNCEFRIKPHKTGKILLSVFHQKSKIDSFFVDSKRVPEFEITTKNELYQVSSSLEIVSPIIDFGYILKIEKFKMQLIRNDKIITDKVIEGDSWVNDIDFENSKKNDKLSIYEVYIKSTDPDSITDFTWKPSKIIITIK